MPCSSGWYSTNGIGAVSLRNGVPDSSSRRVARPYASRSASPQLSASPPWCTSSRITSVRASSRDPLVHRGLDRDLGVRHGDAVVVPRGSQVTVAEGRVEADRDARRGIGPLGLEVLGGRDDDDPVDDATAQQLAREAERERRLAGAGSRRGEEVAGSSARAVGAVEGEVLVERFGLPGAQPLRRAPRRALRVGGREVLGGEAADVRARVLRGGRRLPRHPPPHIAAQAAHTTSDHDRRAGRHRRARYPRSGHEPRKTNARRATKRHPEATNVGPHPWRRFVALGDSFTEGIGDSEPASPGGTPRLGRPRRRGALAAGARLRLREPRGPRQAHRADRRRPGRARARAQARPDHLLGRRQRRDPPGHRSRCDRGPVRGRGRAPAAATARPSSCSPGSTRTSRRCSAASAARSRSTTRTSARSPTATTASSPTSGRSRRCRTRASSTTTACTTTRSVTTRSRAWCCAP